MSYDCPRCKGSGESTGNCMLDCGEVGCTAAIDRTNLNNALSLLPPMIKEEVNWAAYKAGVQMAEAKWALDRANLIEHLRSMWGWAIELDHSGGFFCANEEAAAALDEWKADTRKTLALLQTYDHKKEKTQ